MLENSSEIMKHNPHLHVIFSNHKCYFVDKISKKTLALGIEDNGLFGLVDGVEVKELALMAKSGQSCSSLCHQRYGHLDLRNISYLDNKSLVDGLPEIQNQQGVCGACQVGKQHMSLFEGGQAWRAKEVLQLIHVDICGPMKITSVSSAR
jgi:hypothetical protein